VNRRVLAILSSLGAIATAVACASENDQTPGGAGGSNDGAGGQQWSLGGAGGSNDGAGGRQQCPAWDGGGVCEPWCFPGAAGAIVIDPTPPPEGSTCPVVGHELCNSSGKRSTTHKCTEDGWHTVEHDSECAPVTYPVMGFNCNLPGTHEGTCCSQEVYCPNYGYCDGVSWHAPSACEQVNGALGEACAASGGGKPCAVSRQSGDCGAVPVSVAMECIEGVWQAPAVALCALPESPMTCEPRGIWHLAYEGLPAMIGGLAAPAPRDFEIGYDFDPFRGTAVMAWFGATKEASLTADGCQLTMQATRHYAGVDGGTDFDETVALDLAISGQSATGTVEVQRTGAEKVTAAASATRLEP